MSQPIKQSESVAARRRVWFFLMNSDQTGVILLTDHTVRIMKNGSMAAAAGSLVAPDVTNSPGLWYYQPTAGEIDTLGPFAVTVYDGAGTTQVGGAVAHISYDPYAHPFDLVKDGLEMWKHIVGKTAVLSGPCPDAQGPEGVVTYKDPTGANVRIVITVDPQGNRTAVSHSFTGA